MRSTRLAALAALSMIVGSTAAVAQTAQPLSLSNNPSVMRAGAETARSSELDDRNGIGIYIIGAVVLGLVIWGIIELTKSDEGPSSP